MPEQIDKAISFVNGADLYNTKTSHFMATFSQLFENNDKIDLYLEEKHEYTDFKYNMSSLRSALID